MRRFILLFLLVASATFAQKLEFDVAKISFAQPLNVQDFLSGKGKLGLNVTGQQVQIGYLALPELAAMAYEVKPLDITAPDWMRQQRFDISALMPEGATKDQLPQMMQALLRDRFKLVARKETKEQPMYALEVAKGGHKMKESPALVEKPADTPEAPLAAGERSLNNSGQQMRINQNAGGATINMGGGAAGGLRATVTPDGQMHMEMERLTMKQLAEQLNSLLDLPVMDRTNLEGSFQVVLDLTQADLMQLVSRVSKATGGNLGVPGGTPAGGPQGLTAADPGGTIMQSIQKLGLRLEETKGPVTALVIESADKLPTEN